MKIKSTLSALLIAPCMVTLVSCGSGSGGSSGSSVSRETEQVKEQNDQGIYRSVLQALNTSVAGNTTGTVEVTIEGDDVMVKSTVKGAPAGVKHLQNIMLSGSCPDSSSDANGDGIVDVKEAMARTGEILIPLDSKLSEQLAGIDYGPIANSSGNYVYRRSASLTDLLADLRSPDPDKFDYIVKLPFGDRLNLEGKVVLIHGVKASTSLTDTVASVRDLPAAQTLPIACGKLVRVNTEEPLPAPEAEVPEVSEASDASTPAPELI